MLYELSSLKNPPSSPGELQSRSATSRLGACVSCGCIQRPNTWLHPNVSRNGRFFPLHCARRPYMASKEPFPARQHNRSIAIKLGPIPSLGKQDKSDLGQLCGARSNSAAFGLVVGRVGAAFWSYRSRESLRASWDANFTARVANSRIPPCTLQHPYLLHYPPRVYFE